MSHKLCFRIAPLGRNASDHAKTVCSDFKFGTFIQIYLKYNNLDFFLNTQHFCADITKSLLVLM